MFYFSTSYTMCALCICISWSRAYIWLWKCDCSIADGEVKPVEGELSKSLLENNKCYLLDCGAEVFVWVGRVTQVDERKAACTAAEVIPYCRIYLLNTNDSKWSHWFLVIVQDFVASQKRPKATRITRVIQGYETHSFKSNFDSWPSGSANTAGAEEGRGKVAGAPPFILTSNSFKLRSQ